MDIKKVIFRSGFCADRPGFLGLYLAGLQNPLARPLLIALRLRFSPDILENIRRADLAPDKKSSLFSEAMTLFRSGPSYKTTAANRSPLTDRAVLAKAGPGSVVCETGVSDGISAAALLENSAGAKIVLTDLQGYFLYKDFGPFRLFYNKEDDCLSLKFLFFYLCTGTKAGAAPADAGRISLLNPLLDAAAGRDGIIPFDIFSGTLENKADIIKCANVLNGVYFSLPEIKRALANLSANLNDGGWLFVSQNHEKYADGEAYLAFRKRGALLALSEEVNGHDLLPQLKSPLFSGLVLP